MVAVMAATTIAGGVSDLREYARYRRANMAGIAMVGFMVDLCGPTIRRG